MTSIVADKPSLSSKNTYNLIFSLGEACSCTQTLRASGLQIKSYPFDWLYGTNYIGRCEILASKFAKFIEKEDLEDTNTYNCNKRVYYNKYNDITFNHDFEREIPFQEDYSTVKEKYNRRINRILQKMKKSKKILIVYVEIPFLNHTNVDNETIIDGYNIIKSKFKNYNIDLLYFSNSKTERKKEQLTENITKITCDYKSYDENKQDYDVNMAVLQDFFNANYKLKIPLFYKLNQFFLKTLINMLPIKEKRHELRKKYHL